jgi:gamma-glutamyltranspeptidase/glutathione hydrolase
MHTLNAFLVCKHGRPLYVGGTPGGDFQTQGHVQVLTGLLDFGLDIQQAVDAPRWYSSPGTDPITLHQPVMLQVEAELPEETQHGLAAMGHRMAVAALPGRVQLIAYDHACGTLGGASDSRGDGYSAAA